MRLPLAVLAAFAALTFVTTATAQPVRKDVIWARTTAGAPLTLDGVLDESAWALAESVKINFNFDSGEPGSGWKIESGGLPRDSVRATLRMLTVGDEIWLGVTVRDSSVGGSPDFNRFDGFLMSLKDHRNGGAPAGPQEHLYSWWYPDTTVQANSPGVSPGFIGVWSNFPPGSPRTPEQIANWDARTVVNGLSNSDAVIDQGYTVEMKFKVSALGYDLLAPAGDAVEWSISIYDCDWYWPQNIFRFSAYRTWLQGPWGNSLGYHQMRVQSRPDVTVNSGPVPVIGPDLIVPNGAGYPSPTIDGALTDAVWQTAPSIDIRYGDDALRQSYPGMGKWRSWQYQATVNGGEAAVIDPADATVKYFFRDDSLYLGFDARDLVVQSVNAYDRWDGFTVGIYERTRRSTVDHNLQTRRLAFRVGPTGQAQLEEYLPALVDSGGAQVAMLMRAGTTVDTLGLQADNGYTAELKLVLPKLSYPVGRGDGALWFSITHHDADSFTPFTDSYGTRTWWQAEYDNTCCPAAAYMDPNTFVTGVGDGGVEVAGGYRMLGQYPNPTRIASTLRFALPVDTDVTLELYDLQGRQVSSRPLGLRQAGTQTALLTRSGLGDGLFFYRLRLADPQTGAQRASLAGKVMFID